MILFPVALAVVAGVSALVGLCGGSGMLVIGIAADQYNRRKGYKRGEGVLTPRDGGYWGAKVSLESSSDLGTALAALGTKYPEELGEFMGKRLQITKSEGAQVRAMLVTSLELSAKLIQIERELSKEEDEEMQAVLRIEAESLKTMVRQTLRPVNIFLSSIPKSRIKS